MKVERNSYEGGKETHIATVSVFTSPYLIAGAPALGEAIGLIKNLKEKNFVKK